MPLLAILGTWRAPADSALYRFARDCGAEAAELGWSVASGGYSGVMDAALRGARDRGAPALAYTWSGFDGVLPVTAHATEIHSSAHIAQRAGRLIGDADACLVLPGRLGTVAELALALECRAKNEARCPVMVFGDFWAPFFAWLASSNASLPMPGDPDAPALHRRVDTPGEVASVLRTLGS